MKNCKMKSQSGSALTETLIILALVVVVSAPVLVTSIIPKYRASDESDKITAGFESVIPQRYGVKELSFEGFEGADATMDDDLIGLSTLVKNVSQVNGEICAVAVQYNFDATGTLDSGTVIRSLKSDGTGCIGVTDGLAPPAELSASLTNSISQQLQGSVVTVGTVVTKAGGTLMADVQEPLASTESD